MSFTMLVRRLVTPIRDWKQGFDATLLLCGSLLLIIGAVRLSLRDVGAGCFELWMGWRLWTLARQPKQAVPQAGPNA